MNQDHPAMPDGNSTDEIVCCGLAAASAPPVVLKAGLVELIFEPENGWVRQIRVGNREVVRAIYGAVRDRNWGTVRPVIRDLVIREAGAEGFEIRFTAKCHEREVHLVWNGLIQGDKEGVRFQFEGKACSEFLRNRIGLCVLLPLEGCAGQACSVDHSDGSREHSTMPGHISPHQPFRDLRIFRQKIDETTGLEVCFEGEVFEMEDQRNWTDASFKIYSTPLELPFPVLVHAGDRVNQKVTVRIVREAGTGSASVEVGRGDRGTKEPCTVRVDYSRTRGRPRIGLGLAAIREVCLGGGTLERLRSLQLDHLRVDCRMWEEDWIGRLKLAEEQARAIGCGLQTAVHLSENAEEELHRLVSEAGRLGALVRQWLVFHRQSKCIPPALAARAREILMQLNPQALFAAGTDANFAELNRNRPPSGSNWISCFSINPQVHASDNLTLRENLAGQTEVVKTARIFTEKPLVISPITLLPRNNPNATGATPGAVEPEADSRQFSLFGAGWTLGSLAALTTAHPVHSLTYYETTGARGILKTGESEETSAAFHVLAGFSELAELAELSLGGDQAPLRFAALAGLTRSGRVVLWVANVTGEPARIRVLTESVIRWGRFHEMHCGNRGWWGASGAEIWGDPGSALVPGGEQEIELPRYGLVRLSAEA